MDNRKINYTILKLSLDGQKIKGEQNICFVKYKKKMRERMKWTISESKY